MKPSQKLSADLAADMATLSPLVPQWWELWKRCPLATPFQSPAWLLSWWEIFAPGELFCGFATHEQKLEALFPFYLEKTDRGPRLLPIGISLSDYLDVLVDPQLPAIARAVVEKMCEARWLSWSFENMPPKALAEDLATPLCCKETLSAQEACPVLLLRGGRDLEDCVPARRRRQLRRAWRIAATVGEIRVLRYENEGEQFLDLLFALHSARWSEREQNGVLADRRVQNFHRLTLPRLAAVGLARCYVLTLAGRPVGAYYGLLHRERAYAYLGGFAPDVAEISPGAILIGQAIADAIDEGATEFHFLRGREAYKYGWGATDRWNRRRLWEKALIDA